MTAQEQKRVMPDKAKQRRTQKMTETKAHVPWLVRQGDVYVIEANPEVRTSVHKEVSRENGVIVLAHGDSSAHWHAIEGAGATLFASPTDADRILVATESVSLVVLPKPESDRHAAISIPPGTYIVRRQRASFGEESRYAED